MVRVGDVDVDIIVDIYSVGFCGVMVVYDFDRVLCSKGDYVGIGNYFWVIGF